MKTFILNLALLVVLHVSLSGCTDFEFPDLSGLGGFSGYDNYNYNFGNPYGYNYEATFYVASVVQMALVVHEYDEAIEFYTKKLNFTLLEDTVLTETKRWYWWRHLARQVATCFLLGRQRRAAKQGGQPNRRARISISSYR